MAQTFARRLFTTAIFLFSPAIALAAQLPECTQDELAALPRELSASYRSVGDEPGRTDLISQSLTGANRWRNDSLDGVITSSEINLPFDSTDHFGFDLRFVVDLDGRVTCRTLATPDNSVTQESWTPQRLAWAEALSQWRFRPYLIDGKQTAVVAKLRIDEYELPREHVSMPAGDPTQVVIVQDMPIFGYHLEVHGDGSAVFSSTRPYDALGSQAYHVPADTVAYILSEAEQADFWSLRDAYPRYPKNPDDYDSRIDITLGGQTKSLTDHGERDSGMPRDAFFLAYGIRHTANVDFWWHPRLATIAQLQANGFDFKSEPAGRFLLEITGDSGVNDDVVAAVMALGAPRDAYGAPDSWEEPRNLLESALSAGRKKIARRLIKDGALKTAAATDPAKVNRAFLASIDSREVSAVNLILPYRPAMTYPDPDEPTTAISVLFRLTTTFDNSQHGPLAVTRRLLGLGLDVNARAANGETLLHRMRDNEGMLSFLVAQGADINALDKKGLTPMVAGEDEAPALALLKHGANPRLGRTHEVLRRIFKDNRWPDVKSWLLAHGYGDVLVAPEGNVTETAQN